MSEQQVAEEEPDDNDRTEPAQGSASIDHLSSFRVTYISVVLFLFLYLFTIQVFEEYLKLHFDPIVAEAIAIRATLRPPAQSIRLNLIEYVQKSQWVKFWRVKVDVAVLARDQQTWLYVNGRAQIPSRDDRDPKSTIAAHERLLPATAITEVSLDHNTMLSNVILILYGSMLFVGLFLYNRHVVELENKILADSVESRNRAASKARRIEQEIAVVRHQLQEVEPGKQEDRDEIARLQSSQRNLSADLDALAAQESGLRHQADRAVALEEESRALEELLDEATDDLGAKNTEIRELEKSLKRVRKIAGTSGVRSKESASLAKRMRILYPRLEIDERAIDDIVALHDETTKLRAEECIKRLGDDAGNIGVRRKVAGIPNHLSVYELGFAGKRRVYYAKVQNGRFRVLVIGAKNSQQSDLDYIARIPKGEIIA